MLTRLFSLPAHLLVEDVLIENQVLTLVITSALLEMPCPDFHQPSSRVHSRYTRRLSDLPCQGRAVRLLVQVRRFFCDTLACSRKTFAEQFPLLAPAYARRTSRQAESLCSIAYALGGRAGARLVTRLSMPASRYTLLRLIRQASAPYLPTPRVLGVDDFAWKKGDRYGTILVDLQAHQVVEVLPDREAETFVSWLKSHPGVEVICRDRAGTYADGARRGAPNAIQVVDRFHLLLNLTTALQKLFERKQDSLQRLAAEDKAERMAASKEATSPAPSVPSASPLTATEVRRQARRARRQSRYEEVIKLHTNREPARSRLQHSWGLIAIPFGATSTLLAFPKSSGQANAANEGPYKPYLQARWAEGVRNIKRLLVELREHGYRHGETIVYDYLRSMRKQSAQLQAAPASGKKLAYASSQSSLSAREVAWLFACNPQRLRLAQVAKLDRVRRAEEELETAYQLAQDFRVMVSRRQADVLYRWLTEAKGSGIAELQSLATGIVRDFDAVRAALLLPYSNGQTKGQVNKLKSLKRQMYGRATFEVLRRRVLHAA